MKIKAFIFVKIYSWAMIYDSLYKINLRLVSISYQINFGWLVSK